MKEKIKQLLKRYIGEILIIVGTALSSYNIFNFSIDTGGLCLELGGCDINGVAYFYRDISILYISIGFTLIVAGILVIRNRSL